MLNLVAGASKWLAVPLLVVATFAFYLPSVNVGYFADDFDFAVRYRNGEPIVHAFSRNTDGTLGGGSWRPLTAASLWLTMQAKSPAFDHVISLFLYILLVVMVYVVVRELFSEQSRWFAVGIAFIFAMLPSHAEPVVWVAARADLLAALGGTGALLLWLRGYPWWSLGALIFSCLSKEFWLIFGGALFIIPTKGLPSRRIRFIWTAVFLVFCFAWITIRYYITDYGIGGYSITNEQRVFGVQHLSNELISFTLGVWSYGEFQSFLVHVSQHYWFIITWILVAGYTALVYYALTDKRLRLIVLGLTTTLVPILLLSIPIIRPEASVAEQRYWFAPSIFIVLLFAHLVTKSSKRIVSIVMVTAIVFCILGTRYNIKLFEQAAAYRDEILLSWRDKESALADTHIFGLPDTWYGVHLFASPFFERALDFYNLKAPIRVGEWYQWCTATCRTPAQINVSADKLTFASVDPRIFSVHSRGLRYSVVIPRLQNSSYGFWTGTQWVIIPPRGVEKLKP